VFLGNGFIINEILFSYFIFLYKTVISDRDVTSLVVLGIIRIAVCVGEVHLVLQIVVHNKIIFACGL